MPGMTMRPVASVTIAASSSTWPTATMRPSRIPTSATRPGAPVPSITVPPLMTSSSMSPPIEPAWPATFLTVRQITRPGRPCHPGRVRPIPRPRVGGGTMTIDFWHTTAWMDPTAIRALGRGLRGRRLRRGARLRPPPVSRPSSTPPTRTTTTASPAGPPPRRGPTRGWRSAAMAAVTERLRFAHNIFVFPLRHPVEVAKLASSVGRASPVVGSHSAPGSGGWPRSSRSSARTSTPVVPAPTRASRSAASSGPASR